MATIRPLLVTAAAFLACAPQGFAQQETTAAAPEKPRVQKPKAFEISHGNLFEALRQMAAYRKLDLVIDPDVPNSRGLYAFKHTTWEKALDVLLSSHGLGAEIKDGILRVGLAAQFPADASRPAVERSRASRTIAITFRPSAEGEALLSVSVNGATRAEILEALSKIERLAKAKPDKRSFNASWVLQPLKGGGREDLETFSMEDVTPTGLRALYP